MGLQALPTTGQSGLDYMVLIHTNSTLRSLDPEWVVASPFFSGARSGKAWLGFGQDEPTPRERDGLRLSHRPAPLDFSWALPQDLRVSWGHSFHTGALERRCSACPVHWAHPPWQGAGSHLLISAVWPSPSPAPSMKHQSAFLPLQADHAGTCSSWRKVFVRLPGMPQAQERQ